MISRYFRHAQQRCTIALAAFFLLTAAGRSQPPAGGAGEAAGSLRVMSFNIRNSAARDGVNNWEHRHPLVVSTIRDFDPDLLGTQEVLADQYDQLCAALPEYKAIGVARDDGMRAGEWAAIFYRAARFDRIDAGDFWLSEQPQRIGSKSWDAANIRICSWVKLRDRNSALTILFANTHFDHRGTIARQESAKLLRARLADLAPRDAIILAGDFNCTEADAPYQLLVGSGEGATVPLVDSYREVHPHRSPDEATFHGFKGTLAGARIDWILHSRHFKAIAAAIVRPGAGPAASDHYPVTTTLAPSETK